MKKLIAGTMALSGLVACSAWADAITLKPYEAKTVTVAGKTAEIQDGRVFVSTEAKLSKAGGGEWQVPVSQIDQPQPLRMSVLDGSVSFPQTGGSALPSSYALPEALKAKAYFWVDASDKDASHFVGTADANGSRSVEKWHDVRETDVANPSFMFCQAEHRDTALSPVRLTTNGFDAVWFRGYASGCHASWRTKSGEPHPAGTKNVRHVFAVHGVEESYGIIFGSTNGSASTYVSCWALTSKAQTLATTYFWNSEWCDVSNGRTYLNGERIDGTQTPVRKGFQLLEANSGEVDIGYVTAFYSRGSDKETRGGDFLCEVLAFTEKLSEDERLAVQDYLMHKWFGKRMPLVQVGLAGGTSVTADATSVECDPSGVGTFHLTGNADPVRDFLRGSGFEGTVDVRTRSICLGSPLPVEAKCGTRLTAQPTQLGAKVFVTPDAEPDALIKDGDEHLLVSGIPSDLKTLEVRAGGLTVRAALTNDAVAAAVPTEVYIENHDFEEFTDADLPGGVANLPWGPYNRGWTHSNQGNSSFVYDFDVWRDGVTHGGAKQADGASRAAWNCDVDCPPAGSKALVVRGSGEASTQVTIPRAGLYELSCQAMLRLKYMTKGCSLAVSLADSSGNDVTKFPNVVRHEQSPSGFHHYVLRGVVPQAGNYRLRLRSLHSGTTVMFDDFHLCRVGDGWPVPNGDFSDSSIPSSGAFKSDNTSAGWTFAEQTGWTCPDNQGRASIGPVLLSMAGKYRRGGYYNDSRGNPHDVELLIRGTGGDGSAKAETTFTPPTGTWYLQATLARFGEASAGLVARAVVGETVHDLGTVTPGGKLMKNYRWPVPLTVSGAETVKLRLTLDAGTSKSRGVFVDDLILQPDGPDADTSCELLKNCGFEDGVSPWVKIADDTDPRQKGATLARRYAEANWAFGWDPVGGLLFGTLYRHGGVYQPVYIPAGRYRLSCFVKGRVAMTQTAYYPHPLDVFVARDGRTNLIGRTVGYTSSLWPTNHVKQTFDFTVRDAGTYHVGFRGQWDSSYPEDSETHIDDISLRQVSAARDRRPPFAEDAVIKVDAGAFLKLDFDGTNKVGKVKLGGRTVVGDISAANYPDYIIGEGVLHADPHGMTILLR